MSGRDQRRHIGVVVHDDGRPRDVQALSVVELADLILALALCLGARRLEQRLHLLRGDSVRVVADVEGALEHREARLWIVIAEALERLPHRVGVEARAQSERDALGHVGHLEDLVDLRRVHAVGLLGVPQVVVVDALVDAHLRLPALAVDLDGALALVCVELEQLTGAHR